jgi:hypothetical protein
MSDEQRQPEQQVQVAAAEQPSDKWGDPISEERQAELQGHLDQWKREQYHGERRGPFDGMQLTGANIFHLWFRVGAAPRGHYGPTTGGSVARPSGSVWCHSSVPVARSTA